MRIEVECYSCHCPMEAEPQNGQAPVIEWWCPSCGHGMIMRIRAEADTGRVTRETVRRMCVLPSHQQHL